jgi:DNA invertase Pin-like site-specific DNA recombinase
MKIQINMLKDLAKTNSLDVCHVYEEFGSTVSENRPHFDSLIKHVEKELINGVICWNIDRLTRHIESSLQLYDLVKKGKLEIVTPSGTTQKGELFLTALFIPCLQEFERQDRSRRIKAGMAIRKEKLKNIVKLSSKSKIKKSEGGESL